MKIFWFTTSIKICIETPLKYGQFFGHVGHVTCQVTEVARYRTMSRDHRAIIARRRTMSGDMGDSLATSRDHRAMIARRRAMIARLVATGW